MAQSIRQLQKYFDPILPDIHGLMKIAWHACSRQADYVILFRDNFNWHIQLSDFVSNGLHEIGKLSVNVTPFFWLYFKMSDTKKDFQHIRLEFEVGLVEKLLGGINKLHWQVAGFFYFFPLSKSIKMNSLCQISSKMLHSTQVFILL